MRQACHGLALVSLYVCVCVCARAWVCKQGRDSLSLAGELPVLDRTEHSQIGSLASDG